MVLGRVPGGSRNADGRLWQVDCSSNKKKLKEPCRRRKQRGGQMVLLEAHVPRGPASDALIQLSIRPGTPISPSLAWRADWPGGESSGRAGGERMT